MLFIPTGKIQGLLSENKEAQGSIVAFGLP
jgi:hypothetical protein